MNISKLLTLSTAHLKPVTMDFLVLESIKGYYGLSVYTNEYGFFVYVDAEEEPKNIPCDLSDCLQLAKENDCEWIKFDRDEVPIDNLKVYES